MKKILKFIPAGSAVLAIATFASYALGLVRDRMFAHTFGASRVLDAYNAAFLVPDLLFNILIASGIAAAFVPIFIELFYSNRPKSYEYTNSVISGATLVMIVSALFLIIFSSSVSNLIAPGFNLQDRLLVSRILRILAISPILFGISNTLGAMLVARRRFLYYGLSPVFYNLGIIGGTLFLAPSFGIMGVAVGTVAGAFLHLSIRIMDSLLSGFRFKLNFHFRTAEFKKTIKLMVPKMFGHPVELAMFWGFTVIASTLQVGSVAVISFARNFQSVPVGLIGVTLATTSFPIMAKAIANHSPEEFRKILKKSFWLIFGGSTLAAVAIFLLREPIIRIALGGGAFNSEAIRRTALTLGVFTLSVPTESLVHLLARAFYATKNTTIPVATSILSLIIAISGGYILLPYLNILAIPLSFFIASLIELIILLTLLPGRMRRLPYAPQINTEIDPNQS